MNFEKIAPLLPLVFAVVFFVHRSFKFRRIRGRVQQLLEEGAVLIDVRNPGEFANGANPASINIPLAELAAKTKSISRTKSLIVCCASGTRSGMAVGILKSNGFDVVVNAGPWTNTLTS